MWQEEYSAKVLKFYRLTNDFRELNARSKLEKWPLPFITEILDRMKGSDRYSTGDMADAFFLCPLTEKSLQQEQYQLMLNNSLTFKASKAHLNYKSQRILGHIMSKHGRTVDPSIVSAINKLAVPTTLTGLQSNFTFRVVHRKGKDHWDADAISRLMQIDEVVRVNTIDSLRTDTSTLTEEERHSLLRVGIKARFGTKESQPEYQVLLERMARVIETQDTVHAADVQEAWMQEKEYRMVSRIMQTPAESGGG
ncbi:hypothetical protein B484DRAFT_408678 [Ochromonadaceae sp. CCMP2298]|nr:hypothetical protein B484DRAFT_408678 [Ochromonadaceae sp. CCMP2298]